MGFFSDLGGGINSLFSNLTPNNDAGGLLNPQDALAARQQGQLGLGAGLLSAAGPSPYPISFGQAISAGALQSNAMQNRSIDDALKRKLVASEIMQRMQPPAADNELVAIQTPQGPRLVPKVLAARMPGGVTPYNPQGDYQSAQVQNEKDRLAQQDKIERDRLAQEKAIADARIQLERDQLAAKPGPDAKLDEPLTPEQLNAMVGPNGPIPYGTTGRQAAAMGAMPQTADMAKQKTAVQTARNTVQTLKEQAFGPDGKSGVFTGNGGSFLTDNLIARGLLGASNAMGYEFGTDASKKRDEYTKTANAALAPIVRALGDSGALSDPDIKRAQGFLPQLGALPTTESEAKSQFATLEQLINKGLDNQERGVRYDGKPMSSGTTAQVPHYTFDPSTGRLVASQ